MTQKTLMISLMKKMSTKRYEEKALRAASGYLLIETPRLNAGSVDGYELGHATSTFLNWRCPGRNLEK